VRGEKYYSKACNVVVDVYVRSGYVIFCRTMKYKKNKNHLLDFFLKKMPNMWREKFIIVV
jgi:hypothetical protein